jgi:hypothetical protein
MLGLFARGVMVLFTLLAGSWLNMAASIQRILGHRALAGQHPQTPLQIIDWLDATARVGMPIRPRSFGAASAPPDACGRGNADMR